MVSARSSILGASRFTGLQHSGRGPFFIKPLLAWLSFTFWLRPGGRRSFLDTP